MDKKSSESRCISGLHVNVEQGQGELAECGDSSEPFIGLEDKVK